MTVVERLSRWKDEGVITPVQFERLGAIVRKDRFSVSLELNALLYIGVLSIAAGLLWTVRTHFTELGDTAIVGALTVIVALCFGYCFSRARPYSPGEVESPTAIFDYVLYLGCLVFAIELAFVEMRFALLKDAWDCYVLVSAAVFFAAAYRFDNRFVLSLALSTLAAWFGITLSRFGFDPADSLRVSALVYGALVAGTGIALQRLAIKPHFVETHLHVAATAAFVALTSGVTSANTGFFYLFGLLTLAAYLDCVRHPAPRVRVRRLWSGLSLRRHQPEAGSVAERHDHDGLRRRVGHCHGDRDRIRGASLWTRRMSVYDGRRRTDSHGRAGPSLDTVRVAGHGARRLDRIRSPDAPQTHESRAAIRPLHLRHHRRVGVGGALDRRIQSQTRFSSGMDSHRRRASPVSSSRSSSFSSFSSIVSASKRRSPCGRWCCWLSASAFSRRC